MAVRQDARLMMCFESAHTTGCLLDAGVIEQATVLVNSAIKCLAAARSLIAASGHRDLMEDFLAQAVESSAEAELLLARAEEEERAAESAEVLGARERSEAGLPSDVEPVDLARVAQQKAASALRLIADETERSARLLRGHCEAIRAEARSLLADL